MKKLFRYIEPLWLGKNGKVSIRSTLAIAFSWNFMWNLTHAVRKWDNGKSISDVAMVLGIEAGLIAGLLALRTYQNTQFESRNGSVTPLPPDNCQNNSYQGSGGGTIGTE
jgi:hypothetical protein